MWRCPVCGTAIQDESWQECWKCGAARSLPAEAAAGERGQLERRLRRSTELECLRCRTPLRYLGTKRFHEGSRQWGFWLGDLGELFVNREAFDVYACPKCGKVEFFVNGIGEQERSESV